MAEVSYIEIARVVAEKAAYPSAALDAHTTFEELSLDSLVLVELAVTLEGRYGVAVTDEELAAAATLGGVAILVNERLRGGG